MEYQELMAGFAEKVGLADFQSSADGVYRVEVDGMAVNFVEEPELRQIVTWAEVGESPREGCERLYRVLLEAANLGRSTGGSNFSIDSETGNIQLFRADPLQLMDVETFMTKLEWFINVLEKWRTILSHFDEMAPEIIKAEAASIEESRQFGLGGFMQV